MPFASKSMDFTGAAFVVVSADAFHLDGRFAFETNHFLLFVAVSILADHNWIAKPIEHTYIHIGN